MPDILTDEQKKALEDEEKAKQGSPKPSFDMSELQETIKKSVAESVQQHLSTVDKGREKIDDEPDTPTYGNPLDQVINPILKPQLKEFERKIQLQTAAATDAALFYSKHPEEAVNRDAIEEAFNNALSQGTPISREAISDWLYGKNRKKNLEVALKQHDEEIAKAKAEAEGAPGGKPSVTVKRAEDLSPEDLSKAMEGVTF